jgi:membrane-bound lytic murein transglycosylase D
MKLSLTRVFGLMLALTAPGMAAGVELPSQGLEQRVEFWKKIFTQYGKEDIVIHDRVHVNLIYDVATDDDLSSKRAAVEQALEEIADNLETPENLSITAKQIRDAIVAQELSLAPGLISELRDDIHTQRGIKERFRDGVVRSGRYVDAFQEIFEREGLPTEIALLPFVESSFENRALSNAGAAGIWQFTRGTGRLYLRITRKVDERLDPAKATRAAARLMRDNYKALGSWPLAITAYNHGRGGMMRAQNEHGSDMSSIIKEYRGNLFGYASMNFYSEFLAAVDVYQNYQQYFGELVLDKPTMRQGVSPKKPVQTAKASTSDKYKVRKGDTLWEIAQRFGVNMRELMQANNLRNQAIYAGQILLLK